MDSDIRDFKVASSDAVIRLLESVAKDGVMARIFVEELVAKAKADGLTFNQHSLLTDASFGIVSVSRTVSPSGNPEEPAHAINDTRYRPREKCPDCGKIAVDPDDGMPVCPACFDRQMTKPQRQENGR